VRASEYWKALVDAVAPRERVGRKIEMTLTQDFSYYVELLTKVTAARKHLEAVEERINNDLRAMPPGIAASYGASLVPGRKLPKFRPSVVRQLHDELGDDFYRIASITKKAVEDTFDKETADAIMGRADRIEGQPMVRVGD
jgi:hypothetical protein